jgi:hypothetical protein
MARLVHGGCTSNARQRRKTTLGQAHQFGIFMMKAVPDGRATELIDLAKVNLIR